jgi:hypothetical protein
MLNNSARASMRILWLLAGLMPLGVYAADTPQPAAQQPPPASAAASAATPQAQPPTQPAPATKPATTATKPAAQQTGSTSTAKPKTDVKKTKGKPKPTRYQPDRFAGRAGKYYELTWGVDSLSVKLVESGELVRFSYRVLDPTRAKVLNDKQNEATLQDPRAGVSLVVPVMEKVGQLRQSATPEAGRSYWMTFSNKGGRVVRGDRVDVKIGTFKANFLVVD